MHYRKLDGLEAVIGDTGIEPAIAVHVPTGEQQFFCPVTNVQKYG
ncbi:hypothetical protein [Devosia sp. A449]